MNTLDSIDNSVDSLYDLLIEQINQSYNYMPSALGNHQPSPEQIATQACYDAAARNGEGGGVFSDQELSAIVTQTLRNNGVPVPVNVHTPTGRVYIPSNYSPRRQGSGIGVIVLIVIVLLVVASCFIAASNALNVGDTQKAELSRQSSVQQRINNTDNMQVKYMICTAEAQRLGQNNLPCQIYLEGGE